MGKIFYIMGKSASGKDSIYRMLLQKKELNLKRIIPYTTRPARNGEEQGREYYFVDEERYRELREEGKLIESRAYETVHGVWIYFTADDGQIDLDRYDYLMIGTLVSYRALREYFGEERLVPIYIEVEDGLRLSRALERERRQAEPKYAEMCRRFLADTEDFSEENIRAAGIIYRFQNTELEKCASEIERHIGV